MNGSPWQAVVWDATQAKLLVVSPETLNSADAGYQSGKQRRRLYNAIALNQWSQHSFDKASNSFFTPPEYSAIGCEIEDERCYGVMNYVTLTMPDNITVGDTVRFVARAGGNSACAAEYYFAFQNFYATNTTGVFDVPVTSAGTFNAVATAECCSYMKFVSKPVSVAAPNSCPASISGSAKPVNFRETSSEALANGTVFFKYNWDSSNGNLIDLQECDVSEDVIYPSTSNPYILPSPWTHSVPNPTNKKEHRASDGGFWDQNKPPAIAKPYKEAEFTATQRFRYRCPCINGGEWAYFILKTPEPIGYSIHRAIIKNANGSYRYEITKSNQLGTINPLP